MTAPALTKGATSAETVHGQREYLLPSMLHLYKEPLVLAGGEGVRVHDPEGREYLDLFNAELVTGLLNPLFVVIITPLVVAFFSWMVEC